MASVFDRVRKVCCEHFGIAEETITPASNLICDFKADSLDFVELMILVEEEFKLDDLSLEVSNVDAEELETVAALVDFVAKKRIQRLVAG